MIEASELVQIKARLLLAADGCRRMVESNQPAVFYDEQAYWEMQAAFASLRMDVTAVLSELDVWREMFADRVNQFIGSGGLTDAVVSGSGDRENAGEALAGVPDGQDFGSGEPPQPDNPAASSDVPAKRATRRRKPRSNKTGDQGSLPVAPQPVDGGAGEGPVGGGPVD